MYKLYIDESGKNRLSGIRTFEPHFSIGGVLVDDARTTGAADFLRRRGDQIKFKYWGVRDDVVFHGFDIRRKTGDYSIFKQDAARYAEFQTDLEQYIASAGFKFIWIGVNKLKWIASNPPIAHAITNGFKLVKFEKRLTQALFEEVLVTYISFLIQQNTTGQIIVEASDQVQDGDLLEVFNKLMFNGYTGAGWTSQDVRSRLTSMSFVTKKNKDHETQAADLGSYFLSIDAREEDQVGYNKITSFDRSMATLFKQKGYNYTDHLGITMHSIQRLV